MHWVLTTTSAQICRTICASGRSEMSEWTPLVLNLIGAHAIKEEVIYNKESFLLRYSSKWECEKYSRRHVLNVQPVISIEEWNFIELWRRRNWMRTRFDSYFYLRSGALRDSAASISFAFTFSPLLRHAGASPDSAWGLFGASPLRGKNTWCMPVAPSVRA